MAEIKDPRFAGIELDELAVEIAVCLFYNVPFESHLLKNDEWGWLTIFDQTVKVAIKITPYLRGKMHIQTNPYYAYSTDKTIANAFRGFFFFYLVHCIFGESLSDVD